MREIYYAATDVSSPNHWPQTVRATLIAQDPKTAEKYRVTLKFDTSYVDQSEATVSVMGDHQFNKLVWLHAREVDMIREYYDAEPPRRRLVMTPARLRRCVEDLAELGRRIVT